MDVKQIMEKQSLNTTSFVANAKNLPLLSGNPKILIDDSAVEMFNAIKNGVKINNFKGVKQETSFVLLGYETPNNLIYIKKCIPAMQTSDVYNGSDYKSWEFLDRCVDMALQFHQGKPIVILGHTHPGIYEINSQGERVQKESANCWSSADLISSYDYKIHYQDKIQIADMLITPSLDINTLYLETSEGVEGFYRFAEVLTFDRNKECYVKEKSYSDTTKPFEKLDPRILEEQTYSR